MVEIKRLVERQTVNVETYNLTLVGYAPLEDPEVAFSVVVPWVHDDKTGINGYIGREIMDAYFDLKTKK